MRIIYDLDELEGTCYFEILPGMYQGECWNDNSIYFEEEVFGYLELSLQKAIDFDHYGFHSIEIANWDGIIQNFVETKSILQNAANIEQLDQFVGFLYNNTRNDFMKEFEVNCKSLITIIDEFISWIMEVRLGHQHISILGI